MGICTTESKAWELFVAQHGGAVAGALLERICDALCGGNDDGISIITRIDHDAINCICCGEILHACEWIYFVVENGNWNGTVIREWGEDDQHVNITPEPVLYTLLPSEPGLNKWNNPFAWKNYLRQRNAPWFQELLGKYLYDRHFAPGDSTERYWKVKFAEKGLRLGEMDEFASLRKIRKP